MILQTQEQRGDLEKRQSSEQPMFLWVGTRRAMHPWGLVQQACIQGKLLLPFCPINRHLGATTNHCSPDLRLAAVFWTKISFVYQKAELCQPRLIRGISLLPKTCDIAAFKEGTESSWQAQQMLDGLACWIFKQYFSVSARMQV